MGKISIDHKIRVVTINGKKRRKKIVINKEFEKFNPNILGLGDISLPSKEVRALAAVFDLSGFTSFCTQVDPHLAVPEFLSQFLSWLFKEIRNEFVRVSYPKGKKLWAELPFLAKFLGDGVLFLWDTEKMDEVDICNIVVSLDKICFSYKTKFYSKIKKSLVNPPAVLRCGVARGNVFTIGNEEDYVGSCINIASRLQKLSNLTFCFSRRGFNIEKNMALSARNEFVEKRVNIRGINENELVWVLVKEFNNLPVEEKKLFKKP